MVPRLGDWYRSTFGHALVGAALLWAALPPLDLFYLWPLAWIAPVWWVVLIRIDRLPGKRPYVWLWLAGFIFWLAALHWMWIPNWFMAAAWVALSFYLAFYLPVFIGLARVAVHRLQVPVILAAPVVWTGLELARGYLLTGFTVASLGHTQYRWLHLIQLSDLAGAYGVGFLMMFVAACLARTLPSEGRRRVLWPLIPAALLLAFTIIYGHLRLSTEDAEAGGPKARIALIQGSIDVELNPKEGTRERMHRQYVRLTQKAIDRYQDLDLIIWPETVYGGFLFDHDPKPALPEEWPGSEDDFRDWLAESVSLSHRGMTGWADHFGSPLLLGVGTWYLAHDGQKHFNSAALVLPGQGVVGRYDKMHLVVFGEYVPFADELSWLVELTPLSTLPINADAGSEPTAFELNGLRIAPNICYESVLPQVIRRQVNTLARQGREPDVLVNLTNDGWFKGSAQLDMHLVCGVFRAVECRKPFLIAANTGFSAWIDAEGRIIQQGPRRATGTILASVGPDRRGSLYLTLGDWPAGLCLIACLVFTAIGAWDRFSRPGADKSPAGK